MKRFLCLAAAICVLFTATAFGDGIATPSDLCTHENTHVVVTDDGWHHVRCVDCDFELGSAGGHINISNSFEFDYSQHWQVCEDCGGKANIDEHYAICSNPNVCTVCGAQNINAPFVVHDNTNANTHCFVTDDGWHHNYCDGCDLEVSSSSDHIYGEPWEFDDSQHWTFCTDCGEKIGINYHSANCQNPTQCATCGATGVEISYVSHNYGSYYAENYEHDVENHWCICDDCGEKISVALHWADCEDPTVCMYCGAADVNIACISHDFDPDYVHDNLGHWMPCKKCGEKVNYYVHHANCSNPNVCADCGASGIEINYVMHEYDYENYKYNKNQHWLECKSCGEQYAKQDHLVNCSDTATCTICKGTNIEAANVEHTYGVTKYNSKYHLNKCIFCGDEYKSEHYAECANPTVCVGCGATDISVSSVSHHSSESYEHDNEKHWLYCDDCGEKMIDSEHYACCTNPTVCATCGASNVKISNFSHNYNNVSYKYDNRLHHEICDDCGEVISDDVHHAICTDPTVCYTCGASDVFITYVDHIGSSEPYQYDDENHWIMCSGCEKRAHVNSHWAPCDKPDECEECGASASEVNINIYHSTEFKVTEHDEKNHWWKCTDCGEKCDVEEHWSDCTSTNACNNCGATDVKLSYIEHYNHIYAVQEHDNKYHWAICSECGEEINYGEHYATCANPNKCANEDCQATGVEISYIIHDDKYSHDKTTCTRTCHDCGRVETGLHLASCTTDKIMCENCHFSEPKITIGEVLHYKIGAVENKSTGEYRFFDRENLTYQHDESSHWVLCDECHDGKKFRTDSHTIDDSGFCTVCGYQAPLPTVEPTAEPTIEPTVEPTPAFTAKPTQKPAASSEKQPCTHSSGFTCTYNGDGTHTTVCRDCGKSAVRSCVMIENVSGITAIAICRDCCHVEIRTAAGSEQEVVSDKEAAILPSRLENISAVLPAGATLVAALIGNPESAFNIEGMNIETCISISIVAEDIVEDLGGEITVALTLEDPTIIDGKKLLRMDEDAEIKGEYSVLTNVDFTLEEDVLTFTTDRLGIFLVASAKE